MSDDDLEDKWICDSMVDPECDELFDSEEEMQEHKREDHKEPSQRRMTAPGFDENKGKYKIEAFIGIEVSDITSNHGMPIQYFECPFCQNRCVGFDLFEGCDECGSTFKIVAENENLPDISIDEEDI